MKTEILKLIEQMTNGINDPTLKMSISSLLATTYRLEVSRGASDKDALRTALDGVAKTIKPR